MTDQGKLRVKPSRHQANPRRKRFQAKPFSHRNRGAISLLADAALGCLAACIGVPTFPARPVLGVPSGDFFTRARGAGLSAPRRG
jgi:hypothetical protein